MYKEEEEEEGCKMEVFGSWGVICREGEEEFGELWKSDKCG